jgi:hypothetical protein
VKSADFDSLSDPVQIFDFPNNELALKERDAENLVETVNGQEAQGHLTFPVTWWGKQRFKGGNSVV